jgi:hypothetical protein
MTMHKIPESAILGRDSGISGVPIRILDTDGTTARVQIEGCGIHVRQGQIHTVPADKIRRHDDYS